MPTYRAIQLKGKGGLDQLQEVDLPLMAPRKGGLVVGYGFMAARGTIDTLQGFVSLFLGARSSGRRGTFYGITALYRKDKRPFKEDLPKLFELLAALGIQPRIAARLPLLAGRDAERLLEAGGIVGKVVLLSHCS
jgi:NADPH:quinone reductase-like Zn-dependent oxidoreductase